MLIAVVSPYYTLGNALTTILLLCVLVTGNMRNTREGEEERERERERENKKKGRLHTTNIIILNVQEYSSYSVSVML